MKGTKGLFRLGMLALALTFMVLAGCKTDPDDPGGGGDTYARWPASLAGTTKSGQEWTLTGSTDNNYWNCYNPDDTSYHSFASFHVTSYTYATTCYCT